MRKQGTGGAIVNFSSGSAFRGSALRISYDAAKGGIVAMTRSAAVQLTPYNIRVNSVSPGYVATKMTGYAGSRPESVTEVFLYLASDESKKLTGKMLSASDWKAEVKREQR